MQNQRGNFLLQALLALTLSFVFMPFFASKLAVRDMSAKMHSVTQQVEYVYNAATNYLRENKNDLNYGQTEYADDVLVNVLQHYGLPLGFRNETIFGQTMSLVINKKEDYIGAEIRIQGGKLSDVQTAELIRRLDLFARDEGSGNISVFVPVDSSVTAYTDIVLKEELEDGVFLSDLNMQGYNIYGLGGLGSEFTDDYINNGTNGADVGVFDSGEFKKITVFGSDQKYNRFRSFNNMTGSTEVYNFLSITGSDVQIGSNMKVNYISASASASEKFLPSLTTTSLQAGNFIMIADSVNFNAPTTWTEIKNNFVAKDYTLKVKPDDNSGLLKVNSDIIVIKKDPSTETVNKNGIIEVDNLVAENIIVGQSTVKQLKEGKQTNIKIQISPAGTSWFKDIYTNKIGGKDMDNDNMYFIQNPSGNATLVNCSEAFSEKGVPFEIHSLAQHIICQYIYWYTLEYRLRIKNKTWN